MRNVVMCLGILSVVVSSATSVDAGPFRWRRGGCTTYSTGSTNCPTNSGCGTASRGCEPLGGPMEVLRVVVEPTFVNETRTRCCSETKQEERQRCVKVYRTIPIEEERVTTETFWTEQTETKTIEYEVITPVQEEKTITYTTTEPVWSEKEETYMVKVPVLKEVESTYTIKAPVVKEVEFEYTVQVPYPVRKAVSHTFTNMQPVARIKTVSHCVPVLKTTSVVRNSGHWETQVVETPTTQTCYRNGRCYSQPVCRTSCKRVWVPNCHPEVATVVEKTHQDQELTYIAYEPVKDEIAFECTQICYKPETRTGTKKVVVYEDQEKSVMKMVAEYEEQPRKRMQKVLTFKEVTKKETYPVISYKKEMKTKEVTYTVKVPETRVNREVVKSTKRIAEDKIETYMATVTVPVLKEETIRVCKMVPKVTSVMVNPCGRGSSSCCSN